TDPQGDPLPVGALARLGTTRLRHGAEVTFVAFGADGKTLVTASPDSTIRLWDLTKRTEIRRFTRPRPVATRPGGEQQAQARGRGEETRSGRGARSADVRDAE